MDPSPWIRLCRNDRTYPSPGAWGAEVGHSWNNSTILTANEKCYSQYTRMTGASRDVSTQSWRMIYQGGGKYRHHQIRSEVTGVSSDALGSLRWTLATGMACENTIARIMENAVHLAMQWPEFNPELGYAYCLSELNGTYLLCHQCAGLSEMVFLRDNANFSAVWSDCEEGTPC